MQRLIDADLAPAGERHPREEPPALGDDREALDSALLHRADEGGDILDHEVQLLDIVAASGMHRDLRGRQSEDQPTVAGVDVGKAEDVLEERAVFRRVGAVEDGVGADDHAGIVTRRGSALNLDAPSPQIARTRDGPILAG